MDLYTREVKKILADTSVPDGARELDRTAVEAAITEITAKLKGPLSNVERLWLIEDRQHLRNRLSQLDKGGG